MKTIVNRFSLTLITAAGIAIFAMAILVGVSVVSRVFFGKPLASLFEFVEYGILLITFFAAGPLVLSDGHVRVDLIGHRGRLGRMLNRISAVLVIAISGLLAVAFGWVAYENFLSGATTTSFLQLPRWPLMAAMAIGMTLALAAALLPRALATADSDLDDGHEPEPGV